MYNAERTVEVFGYDLNQWKRRPKILIGLTGNKKPKDMPVIDNCPNCGIERTINMNQSRKNKPCSKCFHNSEKMQTIKLAQKGKEFTEEHKQALKDNHWSTRGIPSNFKGQIQSEEAKELIANAARQQSDDLRQQLGEEEYSIRMSLMKTHLPREEFAGFTTPEGVKIRQSPEGKAWTKEILAKSNFTCVKCNTRGGLLHAHHKNAFASFPEQRFDVENGVCLCEACHDDFHVKYGKGNNTQEQFGEWMNG